MSAWDDDDPSMFEDEPKRRRLNSSPLLEQLLPLPPRMVSSVATAEDLYTWLDSQTATQEFAADSLELENGESELDTDRHAQHSPHQLDDVDWRATDSVSRSDSALPTGLEAAAAAATSCAPTAVADPRDCDPTANPFSAALRASFQNLYNSVHPDIPVPSRGELDVCKYHLLELCNCPPQITCLLVMPTWWPLALAALTIWKVSCVRPVLEKHQQLVIYHVMASCVLTMWEMTWRGEWFERSSVTLLGSGGSCQFGVAVANPSASSGARQRAKNAKWRYLPAFYCRRGSGITFLLLLHSPSGQPSVRLGGGRTGTIVDRAAVLPAVLACWQATFPAVQHVPADDVYVFECQPESGCDRVEILSPAGVLQHSAPILSPPRGGTVRRLVPHALHASDSSFSWLENTWVDQSVSATLGAEDFAKTVETVLCMFVRARSYNFN